MARLFASVQTTPRQGRLLNQRHCSETPRSRGVGTPRVAGPLAAFLRGLWVSGLLPPGNGGTVEEAATPKPTKLRRGADSKLGGWQPKEKATQLPQKGGTLSQLMLWDAPHSLKISGSICV